MTLRANVECPSLSPDGRRLVYKKLVGDPPAWRYHVLDLASGRETPLPEARSVDDQAEWLDESHVLYRVEEDVWASPVSGGRPRLYLAPPTRRRSTARTSRSAGPVAGKRSYLRLMKVGIVGMGYVGLPLAVAFCEAGHSVVASTRTSRRSRGSSAARATWRTSPTSARADPRPAARDPALRGAAALRRRDHLRAHAADAQPRARPRPAARRRAGARARAAARPARGARVHDLPGHHPRAPRAAARGVGAGGRQRLQRRLLARAHRPGPHRLHHAHDPEGRRRLHAECLERAATLYAAVCDTVVPVSTPEAAELTKLLENVFRSVNIALVNELAMLCDRMGIDSGRSWTPPHQALRLHALRARPGHGRALPAGGPVLPRLAGARVRRTTEFIELAGEVNQAHAALLRRRSPRAERPREARPRLAGRDPRRLLQGRRGRPARVAGA